MTPPPRSLAATSTLPQGLVGRSLLLAGVAAALGLTTFSGLYRCPMALFVGVPCPGCGLTRATSLLLHGDLAAALHMHPLVLVVLPFLAAALGPPAIAYLRTGSPSPASRRAQHATSLASLSLFVLMLVVWVARFLGAFGGPAPV